MHYKAAKNVLPYYTSFRDTLISRISRYKKKIAKLR